jgi:hypothetical protein
MTKKIATKKQKNKKTITGAIKFGLVLDKRDIVVFSIIFWDEYIMLPNINAATTGPIIKNTKGFQE